MKIYRLFAFLYLSALPAWAQNAFPQYNGEKFALIDAKTLKPLTAYKYESIGKFQDGLALSTSRSEAGKLQYSFLNAQGKEPILPTASRMFEFSEGKARFKQGDKYGFMDTQGKPITGTVYTDAHDFKEGRAFVKDSDKRPMFIDAQGNAVVRFQEDFNLVQDFKNGLTLVATLDQYSEGMDTNDPYARPTGKYAFFDKQGKKVIDLQNINEKINYASHFQNGISIVGAINPNYEPENPTRYGVINAKGELIVPLKYSFIEIDEMGFIKAQEYNETTYQSAYGIFDNTGKTIMPCQYNFIFDPIGNHRVFQKRDETVTDYQQYPDRYGIADLQGKIIVEASMKDIYLSKTGEYLELDTLMPLGKIVPEFEYQPTISLYSYKSLGGKPIIAGAHEMQMYTYYTTSTPDANGDIQLEYRKNSLVPFKYVEKIGIINIEKHAIELPLFDDIAPFTEFSKSNYIAVRQGRHWTYITEKMERVWGKYESASNFEDNFYAPVRRAGKWGIINKNEVEVAPFAFDSIVPNITRLKFDVYTNRMAGSVMPHEVFKTHFLPSGHFIAKKDKQWGIISWNGQTVLPFQYDKIQDAFYNYVVVGKAGKFGVVDFAGKELVPPTYSDIKIVNDLVYVRDKGKEGLLDLQNNVIAPAIYDTIQEPLQNYIRVIKDKKIGYLNYEGKEVLPAQYDEVNFYNDNEPFITVAKNGKKGVLNNKFQLIVPCEYDSLAAESWRKYIWVKKNNLVGLLDREGKEAFAVKYQFIDNIDSYSEQPETRKMIAQLKGKWGMLDTTGRAVIPFDYDYMKADFNRLSITIGKKNKFGVLKNTGQILIPLKYDEIGLIQYEMDIVGIKKKKKWGFANATGKETVPPTYDDAQAVQKITNESGTQIPYAIVKKGKYFGVIHAGTGKVAVPIKFDSIDYLPYATTEPITVWKDGVQSQVNFRGEAIQK
jgi:methyl coenzyme M reductase subunit D